MKRFKNILVGIDLSQGDRLVNDKLTSPNSEAVQRALWLARMNSSSLLFFCALDISAKTQYLIEDSTASEPTVVDQAQDRLEKLVAQAAGKGVAADSRVVIGMSWVEIVRQVLRENHDLVIVVTDHSSYDYSMVAKHARMILDTRNATREVKHGRAKIHRL